MPVVVVVEVEVVFHPLGAVVAAAVGLLSCLHLLALLGPPLQPQQYYHAVQDQDQDQEPVDPPLVQTK
jgi:hypothetical protein